MVRRSPYNYKLFIQLLNPVVSSIILLKRVGKRLRVLRIKKLRVGLISLMIIKKESIYTSKYQNNQKPRRVWLVPSRNRHNNSVSRTSRRQITGAIYAHLSSKMATIAGINGLLSEFWLSHQDSREDDRWDVFMKKKAIKTLNVL